MTFTFCHLMHQNSKSLSDCFFKDPFHCPELFSQGEFNHAGLIYTPMKPIIRIQSILWLTVYFKAFSFHLPLPTICVRTARDRNRSVIVSHL